jgi:hypothetical protein
MVVIADQLVKHRQRREHHAFVLRAAPVQVRDRGGLHAAVDVHAAFGLAGGAGGIGHDGKIVRPREVRARRDVLGHCIPPRRRPGRPEEFRHGKIGLRAQVVGVHDGQHVLQAERLDLAQHIVAGDRRDRIRVLDVMAQLLGAVHRVHRHDHRVGAQDGVVGDDELGTVLRIEEHALAALNAEALLQKAGQRVDLALELGVGQPAAVVVDRGALGMPRRAAREVAVHAFPRQLESARLTGRPVGEMPGKHHTR